MPTFHHHPDGHVILRGDGRPYRATVADFAADCQALGLPEYPGLPEGWTERIYDGARDLLGRPDHREDNPEPPGVVADYLAAFFMAGASLNWPTNMQIGSAYSQVTSTAGAHQHNLTTSTNGNHTHIVTVNNTGSGAAHPNMQPTFFINFLIKL